MFSLFMLVVSGMGELSAAPTSYCMVAREIAIKGIDIYTDQPEKGLQALKKARESCLTDVGIGYNLGLAHYKMGQLQEARDMWESVNAEHPDDYKTIVNLSWLRFEMGDDEKAHILAFNGSLQHPKSIPLAHTKLYALFRMGRYLEAYDWLNNPQFEAAQLEEWKQMAADYVTETLWQRFRKGDRLSALRQVINFLVKEYPKEPIFTRAKDQLVLADIDSDAELPYPIPLPHQVWPRSGDIDNRRGQLDDRLQTIPALQQWRKRDDAFAVFAGITGYKRLPARFFGARDAENMHLLLTKRGEFIDDSQHIKLRLNQAASTQNLNNDLDWLLTKGYTNPNAKLLIYFAGLGYAWNRGEDLLLVPHDVKKEDIHPESAISLGRLKERLDALPNQEIIVIIDACFGDDGICGSAAANEGTSIVAPHFYSGKGSWAYGALNGGNKVHGSGRQGAFTYFLLKGMLGAADGNTAATENGMKDGWVGLEEAFHYAVKQQKESDVESDSFYFSNTNANRLTRIGGEQ